eukprot:7670969-Pyramimonas_sp.AAC.1
MSRVVVTWASFSHCPTRGIWGYVSNRCAPGNARRSGPRWAVHPPSRGRGRRGRDWDVLRIRRRVRAIPRRL